MKTYTEDLARRCREAAMLAITSHQSAAPAEVDRAVEEAIRVELARDKPRGLAETVDAPPGRQRKTHRVKCWPEFYAAVRDGRKPFEVRKDDRDYQEGDELLLDEWEPTTRQFTGRPILRRDIGYVARATCIPAGYCVFAISPPAAAPVERDEACAQPVREPGEATYPVCMCAHHRIDHDHEDGGCSGIFGDQRCWCRSFRSRSTPAPSPAPGGARRPARDFSAYLMNMIVTGPDDLIERFVAAIEADRAAQPSGDSSTSIDRIKAAFAKRAEGYAARRHGGVVDAEVLDAIGSLLAAQPSDTAAPRWCAKCRLKSYGDTCYKCGDALASDTAGTTLDHEPSCHTFLVGYNACDCGAAAPGLVPVAEVARWLEWMEMNGSEYGFYGAAKKLLDHSWLRDLERLGGPRGCSCGTPSTVHDVACPAASSATKETTDAE